MAKKSSKSAKIATWQVDEVDSRRKILRVHPKSSSESSPITAASMWRLWLQEIVKDPTMNKSRTIAHLRKHVQDHMPDPGDNKEQWEEWLAGTYNLLAILGGMYGTDPPHELGVELLYRKWIKSPFDHTPPPVKKERVPQRKSKPIEDCGS